MVSLMREKSSDSSSSKLFWILMVVGVLIASGVLAYFATRPAAPVREVRLENAVREGSPDWEQLKSRVVVEEQRDIATQTQSMAGGIQMRLPAKVKNFTGKTLSGLEVVASVVDDKGNVIKEKTAVVIPTQVLPIENNKSSLVTVNIDGFNAKDNRADFRFKVTGIKVE
jgi:hypothetical protein